MSLTSNTIFAVLMALEEDLRRACKEGVSEEADLLTPDETSLAIARLRSERGSVSDEVGSLQLIDYVDLSQLLDIVSRHRAAVSGSISSTADELAALLRDVRRLVPTRNRVCHARPPEPDDLPMVLEVAEHLAQGTSRISFIALSDVLRELSANALYPLTLTIPAFWQIDMPVVDNNLPAPDYADTGFIGRIKDRDNLIKHLLGPHPLVTVTGEGGVGKTSLTLRCLTDLIDRRDAYDAIVWTSLKTSHLSTTGVKSILGAMTSETDILRSIAERFGSRGESVSTEKLFGQVLDVLETFSVLLVIDNLETIDRDALRPLFSAIPRRSKIVVTSRIGIGEFELRYPLQPLDDTDAVRLIRATARLLNVNDLVRRDDTRLKEVANRLFRNPLAIRWFVQSYSEGRSYGDLLNRSRNLEDLLQFCFQNLYTTLDEEQQRILRILVALGQPLSEVQLALLAQIHDIERVRGTMQYLYASNLVLRARDTWAAGEATLWNTSDFARQYILSRDKLVASERARVLPQYRALIHARDSSAAEEGGNPFRTRVIHAASTDEAMVVRSLTEALLSSGRGQHREALAFVETARKLLPDFFEVWRVSAQVREAAGDVAGALSDFDRALDLANGKSDSLLLFYAQFLAKQEQFATGRDVLKDAALRTNAPIPLVAMYGWMQTLSGQAREGAATFESVHEDLFILSGPGRAHYLTQYAESLRRASETETRRDLPREALQYVLRALAVLDEARRSRMTDEYVLRTTQHCVRQAVYALSRNCDETGWSQFFRIAEALAEDFELVGDDDRTIVAFQDRCPSIAERHQFAALFPAQSQARAKVATSPMLSGTLKPIPYGREYGFIAGDNGQDYWVHQAQVSSDLGWEQIRMLREPRVRFFGGKPSVEGRLPRALHVTIESGSSSPHEDVPTRASADG